jgi:homoserine acetyltransferase
MWTAVLSEIHAGRRARLPSDSIWIQLARLEALFLLTPDAVNKQGSDSAVLGVTRQGKAYHETWTLEDYEAQLGAILRHDIANSFNSDLSQAAKAVRARVLIVHSRDDQMVTAEPALTFAPLIQADTLWIRSSCGHVAFFCERNQLTAVVRRFLAR